MLSESLSISSISYLALQTYQYDFSNQFRVVSNGTAQFQMSQFVRIPPTDFLCLTDCKIMADSPTSLTIHINELDLQQFHTLTSGEEGLKHTMKLFRKQDKSAAVED